MWLDLLADTFVCAEDHFEIRLRSGELYEMPEIDEVFPDAEMRWLSDYLRSVSFEDKPKIRSRKLERLRMLDLFFRVKHPNIAVHFAK